MTNEEKEQEKLDSIDRDIYKCILHILVIALIVVGAVGILFASDISIESVFKEIEQILTYIGSSVLISFGIIGLCILSKK